MDKQATDHAGYHAFADDNGNDFGQFEVFWHHDETGWYWWPCFPGCMPDSDSDPIGPFPASADAYRDAISPSGPFPASTD